MRRLTSLSPVPLAAAITAAAIGALLWAGLAAGPTAAHRLLAPSPCTLTPTFEHPAGAAVGEDVPLTLTLKAGCPAGAYGPLHIALLVEASEAFARNPDTGEHLRGDVQTSIKSLIERLDLPNNPWIRIGLVQYNDRSQRLCDLTNDKEEILDCVDGLSAKGETRLDTALKEAVNVLKRGRPGAGAGLREFVVLYSDGANDYTDPRTSQPLEVAAALAALNPAQQPTAGCDSVIKEADALKVENPDVIWSAVCVKCELACIRRIASTQQFIGDIANPDRLYNYYDQLANAMGASPLAQLAVTATIGADLEYVAESGSPPPAEAAPDGSRVAWKLLRTRESERIRLKVRGVRANPAAALCTAFTATFVDNRAGTGTVQIECPTIALSGGARPTNTTRPTDSPSATPEVQDTPVPTERPTVTPTEPPTDTPRSGVYLPVSFHTWPVR